MGFEAGDGVPVDVDGAAVAAAAAGAVAMWVPGDAAAATEAADDGTVLLTLTVEAAVLTPFCTAREEKLKSFRSWKNS